MTYHWQTPIRYVRGLGPVKTKELAKINIHTVGDLLEKQPLHYLYPGGVTIAEAKEGMVVIRAEIEDIRRNYNQAVGATLRDTTGTCQAQWYNSPWLLANLRPGMTVTFWGKYKGGVLQQPRWTTVESSLANVYGGQYGTHHATIRAALKEVLAHVELPDMVSGIYRDTIFKMFHFPHNKGEQQRAEQDLKFDEALQLQLALAERRKEREQATIETMEYDLARAATIKSYFPYQFTEDQLKAIDTIVTTFTSGQFFRKSKVMPMQRLIHGEVGSGKTAVAFYAAMLAAMNGKRTLILAPTTILAQQHYDTLKGMGWDDVRLYTTDKSYAGRHSANIVIGTHALLNNQPFVAGVSLVIIDEFQKFGVEQRAKIQRHNPHLLLLSATPIPRTLATTVFGDLDVSTIRQLPIQRGTIVTRWIVPD